MRNDAEQREQRFCHSQKRQNVSCDDAWSESCSCRCCCFNFLATEIALIYIADSAATAMQCIAHSMQRARTTKARSMSRERGDEPCSA